MHHDRQVALLRRLEQSAPSLNSEPWQLADDAYTLPASTYTDPARFAQELAALFRAKPALEKLRGAGAWVSDELIDRAIALAGEA